MAQRDFRWERYLRQHGGDLSELSAYSLLCPQSPEEVEIREAIKTVDNCPYIPGSTLKGAIRTALLGEILSESSDIYSESLSQLENLIDQGPRGNPRREQPAKRIENLAFGRDPNRDLFRALHVSDTMPLESRSLEIGMAWTVTLDQSTINSSKSETEGRSTKISSSNSKSRQRLTFTLKIDELLFREREKTRLGFSALQEKVLHDIAEACRSATDDLMQSEQDFFDYYKLSEIANVYDKLIDLNNMLPEGAFLLQMDGERATPRTPSPPYLQTTQNRLKIYRWIYENVSN